MNKNPAIKDKWKPGCICTICGTEVKFEHLSKDAKKQAYEKKWGVHYACHEKMINYMDRETR